MNYAQNDAHKILKFQLKPYEMKIAVNSVELKKHNHDILDKTKYQFFLIS